MTTKGFVAESDDWVDRGESILRSEILVCVKHGDRERKVPDENDRTPRLGAY